jgi:hypothetical protein
MSVYPSVYPCCSHLERRASVKRLFHFSFLILDVRTPWTRDQPVARPLPTHKHRINAKIHAFSGIQTHDTSVRAGEDIPCLRPRGHCDRLTPHKWWKWYLLFMCLCLYYISHKFEKFGICSIKSIISSDCKSCTETEVLK